MEIKLARAQVYLKIESPFMLIIVLIITIKEAEISFGEISSLPERRVLSAKKIVNKKPGNDSFFKFEPLEKGGNLPGDS